MPYTGKTTAKAIKAQGTNAKLDFAGIPSEETSTPESASTSSGKRKKAWEPH